MKGPLYDRLPHGRSNDCCYRDQAIQAANDFHYEEVINKLKNAKTDSEISDIMADARRKKK